MGDARLAVNPAQRRKIARLMAFGLRCGLIKLGMTGTDGSRPCRAEIGQLRLQTFDLEPQSCAAGKAQNYDPGWGVSFLKFDRQKIENLVLARRIHVLAFA